MLKVIPAMRGNPPLCSKTKVEPVVQDANGSEYYNDVLIITFSSDVTDVWSTQR